MVLPRWQRKLFFLFNMFFVMFLSHVFCDPLRWTTWIILDLRQQILGHGLDWSQAPPKLSFLLVFFFLDITHSQLPFKECVLEQLQSDQVALVRRRSGGGAVFQDPGCSVFTFIFPSADASAEGLAVGWRMEKRTGSREFPRETAGVGVHVPMEALKIR